MKFDFIGCLGRAACIILVAFLTASSAKSQSDSYHLQKKIPLAAAPGNEEYFDYLTVDPPAHRLYLSHGTEVKVLDATDGSIIGTIGGFRRCHGIALVNELGKGFVTDGESGEVNVFEIASLKITNKIKVAPDADFILYDSASKHVFSFNGKTKNASVIDPVRETVVATIALGGVAEQAASDGKGNIYENIKDANEVLKIDSGTLEIKARWRVTSAGQPVSIAVDAEHRRLFIGSRDPKLLTVMNADNGEVIQSFPIGDRVDTTVFYPQKGLIFSSTGAGIIHVFHEDTPNKFSLVENISTEYGAKTMALDPQSDRIYTDTSDFNASANPTAAQPKPQPTASRGTCHLLIYAR
jgi:DNA-binding beta-propeller fold protein YncE